MPHHDYTVGKIIRQIILAFVHGFFFIHLSSDNEMCTIFIVKKIFLWFINYSLHTHSGVSTPSLLLFLHILLWKTLPHSHMFTAAFG